MLILWWSLAFTSSIRSAPLAKQANVVEEQAAQLKKEDLFEQRIPFFSISREKLLKALNGDMAAMASFLTEWDLDARLLQDQGNVSVKRLPEKTFLRAQYIAKHYLFQAEPHLRENERKLEQNFVMDARGTKIMISPLWKKFLPQTYVTASFLLALLPAEQIIALPKGFRDQTHLYPASSTEKIPLDMDPYSMEKIFLLRPDMAFAARYSHASTLQALHDQGIPLYIAGDGNTLAEILRTLRDIGTAVRRHQKAELLEIFIEGALYALDNYAVLNHTADSRESILFLNQGLDFSVPSAESITMELIKRLPFRLAAKHSENFSTTIGREEIVHLNPDHILIATDARAGLFEEDLAFRATKAYQKRQIRRVDFSVQQTPAQYIVLAYYDIVHALTRQISP